MASKREIRPPKSRFNVTETVVHTIFYIPSENKYIVVPSNSTLYPANLDHECVQPLTAFEMKDRLERFEALYVTHSSSYSEIERKQNLLQNYISSGQTLDAKSSLSFLRESFGDDESSISQSQNLTLSTSEIQPDPPVDFDVTVSSQQAPLETSVLQQMFEKQIEILHYQEKSFKLFQTMAKNIERSRKLLYKIANRSVKTGEFATDGNRTEPLGSEPQVEDIFPREPVIFEGTDLVSFGKKNANIVSFGLDIARRLWSDDELKNGRLLPRRSRGRPSLSHEKSGLWTKAVQTRFQLDDAEDMRPAIVAVNQLGVDLKSGKRMRVL